MASWWWGWEGGVTTNEQYISFGNDRNVLKSDYGDGCTIP